MESGEMSILEARNYGDDRVGSDGVGESQDEKCGFGDSEIGCRFYSGELDSLAEAASMVFGMKNDNFAVKNARIPHLAKRVRKTKRGKVMNDGHGKLVTKEVKFGFEVGDMVWGKVKSYPWWPGQIFNEACAVPSVHQTKKEGYVLVAFFGDSSYGWFDPKELIPFVPHYVEKSKQIEAQAFIDAVEEAENEAGRRAALGLACRCHNILSLQNTNVHGLYSVHIRGYEACGLYSMKQIRNARNGFRPAVMLSFLRHLALMPERKLQTNIDWIKNESLILAYRMAVFEEYVEAYSRTFGTQPIHNSNLTVVLCQLEEVPCQVYLSESHVISESARQSRKHVRPTKVMNQHERVQHISRQISELDVLGAHHFVQGMERSSASTHEEEAVEAAQKPEQGSSPFISGNTKISSSEQFQSKLMKTSENNHEMDTMHDLVCSTPPCDAFAHTKMFVYTSDSADVKLISFKHSEEELSSGKAINIDKKKRKKETESESSKRDLYKIPKSETHESWERQPVDTSGESSLIDKDHLLPNQRGGALGKETELRQLLINLLALAQDPFHGVEQTICGILQHFFLQFKSVVYQKSFITIPSMEDDLAEVKPIKFPSSTLATDGPCSTSTKRLTPDSKPAKKWLKTDGYEKTGQHSSNLEHVKEKHVKGQESLNQLKSFTAQRTTRNQRHVKFKRRDQDEIGVICSTNLVNDFLKKPKTFSRNAETTMLILKFPPKSILPSISELKAKFIRFGPLHLSDTHISWKSLTCFVAFKCEYDALAAYEHGVRNNFLFGNTYVKYQLHTAKVPDLESHKSGEQLMKQTPEKGPNLTTMSPGGSAQPEMPSKSCMNFSMAYEEDYTTTPTLHASHGNLQKSIPLCYPLPCHGLGVICNYEVDQLVEDCNAQYREAGAINTCIFTSDPGQRKDISNQMLSNLIRCSEIVHYLKCSLGYVPRYL